MIMSVYIGALTGFIFLISICFCIGDITEVAETSTLVPVIQIYFDSTQSKVGACILASLIVVIDLGCANALLAEGSRSLYAFSRDKGLPFSKFISRVEPRFQIPMVAIVLSTIIQMAFCSIYFGTVTGFNTVVAIATQGFYLSYAMPLFVRLLAFCSGGHRKSSGPWAMKPAVSVTVNAIGLAYLLFACITFNFPSVYPVTSENMNYTSAAVGVIMFVAAITWFTTAKKQFSGPEVEGIEDLVVGQMGSDSENGGIDDKQIESEKKASL